MTEKHRRVRLKIFVYFFFFFLNTAVLPISIILYILHTASLRGFYNNSEKKNYSFSQFVCWIILSRRFHKSPRSLTCYTKQDCAKKKKKKHFGKDTLNGWLDG